MAFAELTRLHSMNFWIFPVEVFGIRPKTMAFGILKPDVRARQNTMISASVARAFWGPRASRWGPGDKGWLRNSSRRPEPASVRRFGFIPVRQAKNSR